MNLPYGKTKARCLCCAFTSGYTSILPVAVKPFSLPVLWHNKAVLISAGIFVAAVLRIRVNYPLSKAFFACEDSLGEIRLQLRQRAGKPLPEDCC